MYSLSTPSLVKISCEAPWAASAAQLDSEPLCRISFLRDIIDWAYLQSPSNELEARLKIAKETREALDRLEPHQPIRCFRVVHSGWVSSLPSVLWSISSLAILKLKGVVTGSDLAGIERLPHLRLLSLEGWKGLRELPVELFTAGRLEELEVRHCGLEQLPAQIACLRRLAYLILVSNAALKRLPEALFSLPDVQVRLYDCPLARPPLPPELSIEGIDRQMLSEAQERAMRFHEIIALKRADRHLPVSEQVARTAVLCLRGEWKARDVLLQQEARTLSQTLADLCEQQDVQPDHQPEDQQQDLNPLAPSRATLLSTLLPGVLLEQTLLLSRIAQRHLDRLSYRWAIHKAPSL